MSDHEKQDTVVVFQDIHPVFIKLAKRLQQVANFSANGLGIINLTILLYDGEPIQYTRPEVQTLTTLEPKGNSDELCTKLKGVR
jgi:hypothetical protein